MDIIEEESYSYNFIGETLHRPNMSTFEIRENDIFEYDSYEKEIADYKKKLDNAASNISIIPGALVYIS